MESKELKNEMNKLRQVKDVVFKNEVNNNCVFTLSEIKKLIKKYPNDYDLGQNLRKFYLEAIK
jgi:ABC-type phosphate transport system auxiliary subunit